MQVIGVLDDLDEPVERLDVKLLRAHLRALKNLAQHPWTPVLKLFELVECRESELRGERVVDLASAEAVSPERLSSLTTPLGV